MHGGFGRAADNQQLLEEDQDGGGGGRGGYGFGAEGQGGSGGPWAGGSGDAGGGGDGPISAEEELLLSALSAEDRARVLRRLRKMQQKEEREAKVCGRGVGEGERGETRRKCVGGWKFDLSCKIQQHKESWEEDRRGGGPERRGRDEQKLQKCVLIKSGF